MPDNLRAKIIRLASTMSRGSSERKALLSVLASGPAPDGSNWRTYSSKKGVWYGWTKRDGIEFVVSKDEAHGDYPLLIYINGYCYYSRKFPPNKEDQFADAKILFDWYERYKTQHGKVGDGESTEDFYRELVHTMPLTMTYRKVKVNQPIIFDRGR